MRFSEQWLREWVDPPLNRPQLAEQLTLAGLEVDAITPVAGEFQQVVVGHIIDIGPHPQASRLQICQVNIGNTLALSIVCGAANARVGLKVAVARIGAYLPHGVSIKEVKLRGVLSQGMLCSSDELGLTQKSDGILELPEDAPVGHDLRDYLQLADYEFHIHVTPNRGDCLSIKGLAREISALTGQAFHAPLISSTPTCIPDKLAIKVESSVDCSRYMGRILREVNQQAKTPLWMVERLCRSGFRSIHPVVDVTNYVLLEWGQPLHAFDLAHLNSTIYVRRAKEGEKLTLLDGEDVVLDEATLVIADQTRVHAIAGVMGGHYAAVSETTRDIFLESAFFAPTLLAGRARHYGVSSEAAYRFERGVDPEITLEAMERATQLLLSIVGGKAGPVTEYHADQSLAISPIVLHQAHVKKILGLDFTESQIEIILQRLGMRLSPLRSETGKCWQVWPPSWRFDIRIEADLIEELARVEGYDHIPSTLPSIPVYFLPRSESELPVMCLSQRLVDRDYQEAITYSFVSPELQRAISPQQTPLGLVNPISYELSVMRSSLWPGLLNTVLYNQKRQQTRIRLFEIGLCFQEQDGKIIQEPRLAAIVAGECVKEQWGLAKTASDFFTVKADVEALLQLSKQHNKIAFVPGKHPALHPGQTSQIREGETVLGYLGALHPQLLTELDLLSPVYLFELSLTALKQTNVPYFKPFSKFPIVRRDISFWIDKKFLAQTILEQVKFSAGLWFKDTFLFDIYYDHEREQEKRSLALAILWQHSERTLIDEEVDRWLHQIIMDLKQKFAIQVRE